MTAQRTLIPALVFAAGLVCTPTAQAQPYGNAGGYSAYGNDSAYNNGYRRGFDLGRDDARYRRYDYDRHDEYRDADWGYDRGYGDRGGYRDAFRQGFIAGYDDGFYGRGQRSYGYGNEAYRNDGYRSYPAPPAYGNVERGYPRYGGGYGVNPGYDRGYRDGLDKGRDDGKHHDAYDPRRQKWYREADRGYKDDFGSRWAYESAYRDGFLRGYDEGYRERSREHHWW
jgi:hypothetical protein